MNRFVKPTHHSNPTNTWRGKWSFPCSTFARGKKKKKKERKKKEEIQGEEREERGRGKGRGELENEWWTLVLRSPRSCASVLDQVCWRLECRQPGGRHRSKGFRIAGTRMASAGSPVIREKGSIGTVGKQEKEELGRRQLDETGTQARTGEKASFPSLSRPLFNFMRVSWKS